MRINISLSDEAYAALQWVKDYYYDQSGYRFNVSGLVREAILSEVAAINEYEERQQLHKAILF